MSVALVLLACLGGCVSATEDVFETAKAAYTVKADKVRPEGSILVRIFKEESELELWRSGSDGRYALVKSFPMCRWSGKLGPKKATGDRQAPEGFYQVTAGLMNPNSKYHRSFNLGFPNPLEKSLGWSGDALMVHGACSSSGCYAMTDDGVSEIYAAAEKAFALGQSDFQVQAFPFRMTPQQMAKHASDPNISFWRNLKSGYDIFEVTRKEPEVSACAGRYVFDSRRKDGVASMDPRAACPALVAEVAPEVSERRKADLVAERETARTSVPSTAFAYSDGGMNPRFRDLLSRLGPQEMSRLTSRTSVPVSRPDAALADPFSAGR
ncbi:hypothetical protein GCM10011390_02770 [Aureimonas endophytica]|uniref:L,D-TPase catalytic domain-containing protein n=1 Tax=Aureimonas endophytica TaxID=2027858 RepID=A0A917E103_9HYPH|nr:murein L,D-transpeptidase family protein [Aureimonas endophytica]GGD87495.1 hypothetical protein GCM10011390_02770 [Aureimonas endophytica]